MNGMVMDSWPYVIAAYVVTWVFFVVYDGSLVVRGREVRLPKA